MRFDPKKFLSRKFLVSLVGMIVGIAIALGADSSEITQIAGAIASAISAVSYIFGEAMVDAAAAKKEEPIQLIPSTTDTAEEDSSLENHVVYY